VRFLLAFFGVNECNRDISPTANRFARAPPKAGAPELHQMSLQSSADKATALNNSCDRGQKLYFRIRFENVSTCSVDERLLYEVRIVLCGQEDYFCGSTLCYPMCSFESVQVWKTDIEQNYVRLKFVSFPDRF
jgi:hypothetical protein